VSEAERRQRGRRLIEVPRVAPRAARRSKGIGAMSVGWRHSKTARDQHQPASSRAIAVVATVSTVHPAFPHLRQDGAPRVLPPPVGAPASPDLPSVGRWRSR